MKARRWLAGFISFAFAAALSPAALAVAGELDSSFSGNGKLRTHFKGGENYGGDVAVQADGKIVVVGQILRPSGLQPSKIALFRLRPNGTLDATFRGDGRVVTDITHYDGAEAVVIQPDGKIVIAGRGAGGRRRFLLARYKPSGRLDKTFSGNGVALTDFTNGDDQAFAVAVQGDGKIVAAGTARAFSSRATFALARYNSDGSLDTSFSGDGRVQTNFTAENDQARDVAIQTDGKIVAAGAAAMFSLTGAGFALARYDTDGTIDSSFDGDGKLTFSFGGDHDWADGVAVQADGKIVAAGQGGVNPDFALARFETDGTPDAGFGNAGAALTPFSANGWDGASGGLAIQTDGKIVAAGHVNFLRFALARYDTGGNLDTTFSGDGKVATRFGCCGAIARGVAIQADSKIVAAGEQGDTRYLAVARYLGG
jgi:uncharacterized delta-60 repeat protein